MAGVEDVTRLHAMAEANRQAEREQLLGDARLRITRIDIDWPYNMRRVWLDLAGVVVTYVFNCSLWVALAVTVWRDFPEGISRGLAIVWPIVAALSNARLLAEELWRQWKVN